MITGLVVGIIIGFVFSMPPLGPTYAAIIERGLKKEINNAVSVGIGAGFMDLIYILVAYGGVAFISSILPVSVDNFFYNNEEILKLYLSILGCIVVILYGIKIMKKKEDLIKNEQNNELTKTKFKKKIDNTLKTIEYLIKTAEDKVLKALKIKVHENINSDLTGSFFLGIGLCLASPTLAASWFATVGYLKSSGIINSNFLTGLLLGIGVLIGTSVWFYIISKFISKHSDNFSEGFLTKLNFFIGIFLIFLGTFLLIKITVSVI